MGNVVNHSEMCVETTHGGHQKWNQTMGKQLGMCMKAVVFFLLLRDLKLGDATEPGGLVTRGTIHSVVLNLKPCGVLHLSQ